MSTQNLCFRAKIRKKCIPLYIPVLLYKSGVYGGINHWTCYHDVSQHMQQIQVWETLEYIVLKLNIDGSEVRQQRRVWCTLEDDIHRHLSAKTV